MPKSLKFGARRVVKPVSRGVRFEKLRALACFDLAYERIRQGWPLTEVARYIQEDNEAYKDITRHGLVQVLSDFRKTIPAAELVEKRMPGEFIEAKKRIEDSLDEVSELEALYALQMERVKMEYETEKKIKKLMPSMTSEIKEARQLLETISTLKMDLGIKQRAPTQHSVDVEVDEQFGADLAQKYGSAAAKTVIESAEARRKVSGIVERFMKLSTGASLDEEKAVDSE